MSWWHRLRRRGAMELDLEKELRFHLDQHTADLIAAGIPPAEAQRQARLAIGGPEQVKESCRDARGTRWLEELWQDTRYALRTLRQRPGFAAVALCTLALGIGAATVMFTVVNGVLLKPLPYPDPDRLLRLQEQTTWSTHWGNLWGFTYPNYVDCKRDVRALDMAALLNAGGIVSAPGDAEYIDTLEVSSNLFAVLQVDLLRGRTFSPDEDRPGGTPVAIVSHRFWQRRFGGNPAAIGMPVVYDGQPRTIVGITRPDFRLGGQEVDLLTPIGQETSPMMQNRARHGVLVWARLQPRATLPQARSQLAAVGRRLEAEYPKTNRGRTFVADPLRPPVKDVQGTLWMLLGAVGLVLLIACVNIASLLLARAVSRERELAMRVALGAGRGRLVRQCLTESAVLALAGGALGVLLAAAGLRPFVKFWPGALPRAEEVALDGHVLLFAIAVSLLSGVLFGLAPALRVPVGSLERTLHAGARAVGGASHRLHAGFVISEIALAVVLLVSAGMLGRTLLRLASLDPGLNVHNVLTARAALSPATLANSGRTRAAWQEILESARRVPGVQAAAIVDTVPMRQGSNQIGYRTSPADVPPDRQPMASATCVTPDYLKVMGIPLRQGRFLTEHDRLGSESVAVIDEVMAREAFAGGNPIGQYLWIDLGDPRRVVGVVGHVRQWGAADDDPSQVRAQLYYPLAQVPDGALLRRWSELMSIAVRTGVDPLGVVEPLRRAVRGAGGEQVIYEVRTMEGLAASAIALQRFLMLLFGIFAGLALLLASIGIYGVLAYVTSRRVPEFGVRIALGATAGDVMRMVFRQSGAMLAAGIAIGTAVALAAAHVLLRLIDGMRPPEPATFALMIAVLVAAVWVASFLPARRAARVDPMKALRAQ